MKVYAKDCLSCNEPWVYVRLTRREATILVAEAMGVAGKILPRVVDGLKSYKDTA